MKHGEKNRIIRQTMQNVKSSRSHSIFTLVLETKKQQGITRKKLNLCDLAGSERMHHTYNAKSEQFAELRSINLSITALGKVINMLSENVYQHIKLSLE